MVYFNRTTKQICAVVFCFSCFLLVAKLVEIPERYNSMSLSHTIDDRIPSKIMRAKDVLTSAPQVDIESPSTTKQQSLPQSVQPISSASGLQKRPPNTLMIGFSKCGTHALRTYLSMHPKVVAEPMELGFFNKYYDKGLQWYIDHMPESTPDQIVIEKTPSYILSKEAIKRMHELDPSLKIIILVRDPIVRVQSMYAREVFMTEVDGEEFNYTLTEWINNRLKKSARAVTNLGNYAPYIRDVLNIFNEDKVLVLNGERLVERPAEVIKECEQFLNIKPIFEDYFFVWNKDKGFYCINTTIPYFEPIREGLLDNISVSKVTGCFNVNKGRYHPPVPKQMKDKLVNMFRATSEDLFHVIGKRFPWIGFEGDSDEDITD